MTLPPHASTRTLALLTVAVLGVHLLVLRQSLLKEPQQAPGLLQLVTRVLEPASGAPEAPKAVSAPFSEGKRPGVQIPRVRPAINSVAEAIPEAVAAAPAAMAPAAPQGPAMAFAIPGSVHLRYAVTGQSRGRPWNFNGGLEWRHDGSNYEAKLEYSSPVVASRSQKSSGRITAEGLAPQRFSDTNRGERATHFERESGKLVFSSNAPQVDLLPGAQDRLSVFMQLASMLAAEPARFPAGAAITLQTAGTRDAKPWIFTVEGDEVLDLPGGKVSARKLLRIPRGEYDIRVELWLGTGMDYVPVRIRLTQPNGDFVDQQWSSTDRS